MDSKALISFVSSSRSWSRICLQETQTHFGVNYLSFPTNCPFNQPFFYDKTCPDGSVWHCKVTIQSPFPSFNHWIFFFKPGLCSQGAGRIWRYEPVVLFPIIWSTMIENTNGKYQTNKNGFTSLFTSGPPKMVVRGTNGATISNIRTLEHYWSISTNRFS